MTPQASGTLDEAVVEFCRVLRARGFLVGTGEIGDALRSVAVVDALDRDDARLALRAVLTSAKDDLSAFDALFDEFWSASESAAAARRRFPAPATLRHRPTPHAPQVSLDTWMKTAPESRLETLFTKGYSATDATSGSKSLGPHTPQLADIVREAKRLMRALARRPGRRWQAARRGTRLDLRRMMRKSMSTGGEILEIALRRRRPVRRRIVALCDVSGSMDLYSQFLLQFLFALQNAGTSVETFVFATRLSHVTPHLRDADWRAVVGALADGVRDWSGGTRIGDALAGFASRWSHLVDRRTLVIVLSDGWDTGEPGAAEQALATIQAKGARIVWLNPLIASAEYRPETRTMRAALPYLDLFASLHDLASLRALRHELVRLV